MNIRNIANEQHLQALGESHEPLDLSPQIDTIRYLDKLGLDKRVPITIGGLALIQTAHLQHIPYGTIDHFVGMLEPLEPTRIVDRITTAGYAGCCFELNTALFTLLRNLGFNAQRHPAHISREEVSLEARTTGVVNHVTLTVHDLPSDINPNGVWLTDVGMGDGPHRPLPLLSGAYQEGESEYVLKDSRRNGSYQFIHRPLGSFATMGFDIHSPADAKTLDRYHTDLVRPSESRLARNLIVERCPVVSSNGYAVDTLINCELQRLRGETLAIEEILDKSMWLSKLDEVFGLKLGEFSDMEKQELWQRTLVSHAARKKSQNNT